MKCFLLLSLLSLVCKREKQRTDLASPQRVLLGMLPLKLWREVLGFCPFEEYALLIGMQWEPKDEAGAAMGAIHGMPWSSIERWAMAGQEDWDMADQEDWDVEFWGIEWDFQDEEEEPNTHVWCSQPPSREFYFLLKQSLLEMRLCRAFPSAFMGGLWIASRGLQAPCIRKLRLGSPPLSSFLLSLLSAFLSLSLFFSLSFLFSLFSLLPTAASLPPRARVTFVWFFRLFFGCVQLQST